MSSFIHFNQLLSTISNVVESLLFYWFNFQMIMRILSLALLVIIFIQINSVNPELPQVTLQISTEFLFCQGRIINKECYRSMLQFDGVKKRLYTERYETQKTNILLHTGRRVFRINKSQRDCQELMYTPIQPYWRRIPVDKAVYNGTKVVNRVECHTWIWKEKEDDIHQWAYRVSNVTEAVQWKRESGTGLLKYTTQYDFVYFKPREPSFHYFFPPSYCPI